MPITKGHALPRCALPRHVLPSSGSDAHMSGSMLLPSLCAVTVERHPWSAARRKVNTCMQMSTDTCTTACRRGDTRSCTWALQ